MTEILELIISLALTVFAVRAVYLISKRLVLDRRLMALNKTEGIRVKRLRPPLVSLLRLGKRAEYAVELSDRVYLIRLYNGGGALSSVHFASRRFTVKYSRFFASASAARGRGGRISVRRGGIASFAKVREIPGLTVPEEYADGRIIPVMLFNPSPSEVSYVTEKKNSIRVAFTGDEACGLRIYNLKTLLIHIDRECRRLRDAAEAEKLQEPAQGAEDREAFFSFD